MGDKMASVQRLGQTCNGFFCNGDAASNVVCCSSSRYCCIMLTKSGNAGLVAGLCFMEMNRLFATMAALTV
jgi:hypothetical protein